MLKVVRDDGIAGLYDGLTSSLLGVAITNGCVAHLYNPTPAYSCLPRRIYYLL